MRSITEGGDILIIKHWVEPDADCPVPLKLQLLEGDQLDHTMNGPNEMGFVRLGVQFDKEKRRIGYWVFEHHPGDGVIFGSLAQSKFIPATDVLHAYELLRPGQVRGLPIGVASFMKMSDFSDYEDAQLVKQKIAACFAAFVLGSDDNGEEKDDPLERLEPGIIEHLSTTEHVDFANPPSVADYDPYSSRILQGIATAYGITYEMLTKDYSRVNFTSGRMAQINVTKNFRKWQYQMMVPQVCQPVWKWFMNACIVAGLLEKAVKADWTAPRIQQLDPVKEIDAQTKAIQAGVTTLSEVIRETGREPAELYEEYQQDIAALKAAGISTTSVNPTPQKQHHNAE
jgi:lambda family phage portal protein